MAEDSSDREQGVDFSGIDPVLDDLSYPVTTDQLVADHGDRAIERTNAEPITIRDLFGPVDDTLESKEAVRESILNLMPRDAVGRSGYSDRGGSPPDEAGAAGEDESL